MRSLTEDYEAPTFVIESGGKVLKQSSIGLSELVVGRLTCTIAGVVGAEIDVEDERIGSVEGSNRHAHLVDLVWIDGCADAIME